MASIEILNNNEIKVNVNSNDSWSLNVNDSNFMLEKYNGIGTSIVKLKKFSNVGELFGEIELYINGKLCDNYDLKRINNSDSDFFYIIPNIINLNGKGDNKEVFIYTNDNNWDFEQLNGSDKISISKTNNTLIITSIKDEIFYDVRIKVFSNNIDGKPYDYITVNQTFKSYIDETDNELFKVNPTYLLFTKQNEVKNVNVTTSCKEGYEVSDLNNPFSLTDNGNGKISVKYIGNDTESATTTLNVTSCEHSSAVTITYNKSLDDELYLCIISSDTCNNEVTTTLNKENNDTLDELEYVLSSSSKVMVFSKPNSLITSISNLDSNNLCKLKVKFNSNEDLQEQIKLINNDGIFAYINISVSGFSNSKGITFKFNDTDDNIKIIENGEYVVTVNSFYNENKKPLNFNIYTNDFDLVPTSTTKPYTPSSTSTTLTFKAKENVKGNKTIQLEEVETFKILYIKINIGYNNAYYDFYFTDNENIKHYSWYLTYDYKGNLLDSETPMYKQIKSLSGDTINNINKEVSFSPTSYSKSQLGIVNNLTSSTNYSSSFTFTQSGSNNTLKLYVTQLTSSDCECTINSISVIPSSYTFNSSDEIKTFNVYIDNNYCNKCNNGFKVYDINNVEIANGTNSFELSSRSGVFTIKSNDDNTKNCILNLSQYSNIDCSNVSINCNPIEVITGGTNFKNNGTKTTITVSGGETNAWNVLSSPNNDNITTNNTNNSYVCYSYGTYIFQSSECLEKTCSFTVLKPEIKGIFVANNQPGNAKIYKTDVFGNKILLGELNTKEEQTFSVTFDDNGTLNIEYDSNQWCNSNSCFVYISVKGDNLMKSTKFENGTTVDGDTDGATIIANMNSQCDGGFTTINGYYIVDINVKYMGQPY